MCARLEVIVFIFWVFFAFSFLFVVVFLGVVICNVLFLVWYFGFNAGGDRRMDVNFMCLLSLMLTCTKWARG